MPLSPVPLLHSHPFGGFGVRGEALRAFAIDLFDENADPIDTARLGVQATVRLHLSDSLIEALGGLPSVFNDYLTGRIRLQKLSRDGTFWSDLAASFSTRPRTFTTRLSRFSTFVLVRSVSQTATVARGSPTPAATREPATVALHPSMDNTLIEDAAGALSNGSGQHIFVGRTNSGSLRRGLIAFAVSDAVPAGSRVHGAALKLRLSRTQAGPESVSLHRITKDWGEASSIAEGGSGAPAVSGDATWLHARFDTVWWGTPGGDFAPDASARVTVGDSGDHTWASEQMAADVQRWLDGPSSNFGWLLLGNEAGNQTTKRFHSRESDDSDGRPLLTVAFTPPAGTGGVEAAPRQAPATGDVPLPVLTLAALAILGLASILAGGLMLRIRKR